VLGESHHLHPATEVFPLAGGDFGSVLMDVHSCKLSNKCEKLHYNAVEIRYKGGKNSGTQLFEQECQFTSGDLLAII
jgi:hypothetical protein